MTTGGAFLAQHCLGLLPLPQGEERCAGFVGWIHRLLCCVLKAMNCDGFRFRVRVQFRVLTNVSIAIGASE